MVSAPPHRHARWVAPQPGGCRHLLLVAVALQLRRQRRQDRRLADHQDPDQPLLRLDEAGRAEGRRQERRPPVGRRRAGGRRHPVADQRHRHRDRPRRQGHPDHLQRPGGQRGAAPGQGLRPVRDRPRHPARPGQDRRRHLRDQQLPGRQADRRSTPPPGSPASRPSSRCWTSTTTRSSPSTSTATTASSPAWASTRAARR